MLTVVLQLDVLDYLIEQISISSQPLSEQVVLDADDSPDGSDDTNLSLLRGRSIKNVRSRVWICSLHGAVEASVTMLKNRFPIESSVVVLPESCPLRTLFCVFRL